jgi:hypothetical protein
MLTIFILFVGVRLTGDQAIEVMRKFATLTNPLWDAVEADPARFEAEALMLKASELSIFYTRALAGFYNR